MGTRWNVRRDGVTVLAVLLLAPAGLAQDSKTLAELQRWHDELTKSKTAVSVEDGRQALAQIKKWSLKLDDLEVEQRGRLLRLEIIAALAVGDAARAASWLPDLELDFPDTRETLRAAWLVAGASGDAELAQQTLEKLRERKAASTTAVSKRLRRLRMIGRPAPEVDIRTESGRTIPLHERNGVVLVLDFWNVRRKPGDKQIAVLRGLHDAFAHEREVEFLGINSDPPPQVDAAKKFAADSGYQWPQHYERQTKGAPLTDKAFHVDFTPWQVIIDRHGNVRAVGSASAPEFQYALRAAAAEAQGKYAVLWPKTTDGVPAQPRTPVAKAEKKKPAVEKDLPHHPEAKRLLDQARLYLKTGRKRDAKKLLEELIEKYPDTWEAREARRLGLI
ncbi:MAG: redoxin domain-containing protein [Phycisphaerae bacterium]|nr:redoxin domain-containing protein [Phycisphaerae bacterium]